MEEAPVPLWAWTGKSDWAYLQPDVRDFLCAAWPFRVTLRSWLVVGGWMSRELWGWVCCKGLGWLCVEEKFGVDGERAVQVDS